MAKSIKGKVIEIGPQGSLRTNITQQQLAGIPRDETTRVRFGDHETFGIFPADHGQPDSTLVAIIGNSDCLEIEIVGVSLSQMLGIKLNEDVSVEWQ